jgi:hypothetical protein
VTRHPALWLATAMILTGCTATAEGPSRTDSHPTTTIAPSTTTTKVPNPEALAEFRQCLAGHGIEIDPVPFDGTGRPRVDLAVSQLDFADPTVTRALGLCAPVLGKGALDLTEEDALRAMVISQLQAFAVCVRGQGVSEFPDPAPGFTGVGSPFTASEIPYDDQLLESAVAACQAEVFSVLPGTDGS